MRNSLMKHANGGAPAMLKAAIVEVTAVHGILQLNHPSYGCLVLQFGA